MNASLIVAFTVIEDAESVGLGVVRTLEVTGPVVSLTLCKIVLAPTTIPLESSAKSRIWGGVAISFVVNLTRYAPCPR